jgi:ParB-like chromosome segregation protein Spo0J
MKTEKIKITEIHGNKSNPRIIKDDKFKKLVQSIKDFPQMLEIRPIVVDEENVVLGGNMRLKACIEAGLKEVFIIRANELTDEQKQEFIIKDNVGFGEWDWDQLANEWDAEKLDEWGLDLPTFATDVDYSEKNKELNLNDFEDQKYTIKLEYSEDDYNLVKERLQELGQTAEKILYDALISL